MYKAKTSGPDGFSMMFFQECQDIINEDIMKVFEEFFEKGILSIAMKSTFIVLIPKKEGARELGDYWPISLVTSLYKIISKVLSNRLRQLMREIVYSMQGAFIKGMRIINEILIANECVDVRRKSREKGVVCKLDMEKAYDRVD